jgi:CubicO group peptidase (beta-lactamase class C family)
MPNSAFYRTKTPQQPGQTDLRGTLKRLTATLAAGLLLLALGACTTAPLTPEAQFNFREGIGYREVGPNPQNPGLDFIRAVPSTTANYWQPALAPDGFSRMDELFGVSRSAPDSNIQSFRRRVPEPPIHYSLREGGRFNIDDYMNRNPSTGLLVARGDEILLERYQYGRTDHHRMTSFSIAKTVIALLIGIAIEDGKIASIDDSADRYVTALAGSQYGATPIRHLLTMSSGVRFREDYDGNDDSARLSMATWRRLGPGGPAAARLFNERIAAPGSRWYYASSETFVLAMVLRAATGESVADYFSRKVWRHLGTEDIATWLTDATGQEVGYMGLNARVRDFARLAMMMARGGTAKGHRIVSERWIADMTTARFTGSQTGRWFGYGYQTWIFPFADGGWAMLGVRGQSIFVDPRRELVLVNTAARASPRDPGGADTVGLWISLQKSIGTPGALRPANAQTP